MLRDAIKESLVKLVTLGGTKVSPAEFARRNAICAGCEHSNKVLFKSWEVQGCTLCQCPHATKNRMKTHIFNGLTKLVKCAEIGRAHV